MTDDADYINQKLSQKAAGGGRGVVTLSDGDYRCASPIIIPRFIDLAGESMSGTNLYWKDDLGPGVVAIDASQTATLHEASHFRDLSLLGPRWGYTDPPGHDAVQMDGVRIGAWGTMRSCFVAGFRKGVRINREHNIFYGCLIGGYYGVSLDDTPQSSGGPNFYDCHLSGTRFAGLHIGGGAVIDHMLCQYSSFGQSPFGIVKTDYEDGRPATRGIGGMMRFTNSGFEHIGNSAIANLSQYRGDVLFDARFDNPGFAWADWQRIPSLPHDWCLDLKGLAYLRVTGTYPFTSGAVGVANFWSGDVSFDRMVANMNGSGSTWSHGLVHVDGMVDGLANGNLERGDIAQIYPGYYQIGRHRAGQPVLGVVAQAAPSGTPVYVSQPRTRVYVKVRGRVWPAGLTLRPCPDLPHVAEACPPDDPTVFAHATLEAGWDGGTVEAYLL